MEPNSRQQFEEEERALAGAQDEPYPGDPVDVRALVQEVRVHEIDWCWGDAEEKLMDKGARELLATLASAAEISEWAAAWHRKLGDVPGVKEQVVTRLAALALAGSTSPDWSAQADLRRLLHVIGEDAHW